MIPSHQSRDFTDSFPGDLFEHFLQCDPGHHKKKKLNDPFYVFHSKYVTFVHACVHISQIVTVPPAGRLVELRQFGLSAQKKSK